MQVIRIFLFMGFFIGSPWAWAECRNTQNFSQWLNGFSQQAINQGIPAPVTQQAFRGMTLDQDVIRRDRSQKVFAQDFLSFAVKKIESRLRRGQQHIQRNAALFQAIERQYGVPAAVLTSFWGLESDFGAVTGNYPTLRAVTALAYDCRRPDLFQRELISALRLVQRGDLQPTTMRGAWAGEIGQLQFLPSSYDRFAIDYDGNGQRDLIRSSADALASAANMLKQKGWRAGQPWLQEVRVPEKMNWALARRGHLLPLATWMQQGVRYPNGQALRGPGNAALLLPMGRNGPAFLAFHNFNVFLEWNDSSVYSLTSAYFATRLAGAPALRRGNAPVRPLNINQTRQLQSRLKARGLRMTKIDGIIGPETRQAVRQVQQQLKLPADGYPDAALLQRL